MRSVHTKDDAILVKPYDHILLIRGLGAVVGWLECSPPELVEAPGFKTT